MSTLKTNRIENLTTTDGGISIDNSGNVGIGTTTPGAVQHVVSADNSSTQLLAGATSLIRQTGHLNAFGGPYIEATNTAQSAYQPLGLNGSYLSLGTGGSERMRIDSSGNVGIGTTSPTDMLSVGTLGTTTNAILTIGSSTSTSGQIYFGDGTGTNRYRGYIEYAHSSDYLALATAGSERMRIDSSGNVGINENSPNSTLHVTGPSSGTILTLDRAGSYSWKLGQTSGSALTITGDTTERMRITHTGAVRVGSTGSDLAGYFQVVTDSTAQLSNDCAAYIEHSGSDWDLKLNHEYSTAYWLIFAKNGTTHGYVVESGSGVNYYSASDYRLKTNIETLTGATEQLKQLTPRRYEWLSEPGETVDGFIAHEVQEVVPQAVDGEKDGIDKHGNPKYQGLDVAELIPLLTAALQESVERIETLEAEVAALKSN